MPPALDVNTLAQFVDPLPIPEIAKPQGLRASPPDAKLKGSVLSNPGRKPSPVKFIAICHLRSSGASALLLRVQHSRRAPVKPLLVEWVNALPNEHSWPMDRNNSRRRGDQPAVRTVVHLHGAKTGPESDGYPEDWIVPGKFLSLLTTPTSRMRPCSGYHDHALGINRLKCLCRIVGNLSHSRQPGRCA